MTGPELFPVSVKTQYWELVVECESLLVAILVKNNFSFVPDTIFVPFESPEYHIPSLADRLPIT